MYSYLPEVFLAGNSHRMEVFDVREPGKVHATIALHLSHALIQQLRRDFAHRKTTGDQLAAWRASLIPDIGLMVGAYIITRMLRLIVKREPKEHGVVIAFAVGTVIVTVISLFDLLARGTPSGLPNLVP